MLLIFYLKQLMHLLANMWSPGKETGDHHEVDHLYQIHLYIYNVCQFIIVLKRSALLR